MSNRGRPTLVLLLATLLTCAPLSSAQQTAPAPGATSSGSGKFALDDGTPIKLRLNRNLSSADATTGETIDFEALEELKIGDVLVIPKGSIALGTVTKAEHKKNMGRGGKLDVEIDYIKLADGEKAALRAVKETSGGGHTGAMAGAMVATSLVVWPAAPLFLLMHGKDTTIPKGTEITAYINGTMPLDPAKFGVVPAATPDVSAVSAVAGSPGAPPQSSLSQAQVDIASDPTGAEITVDGEFAGDTPSQLTVATGVHTITLTKRGYKPWTRKLTISGSKITIAAELEK
jgi:PEGA domain